MNLPFCKQKSTSVLDFSSLLTYLFLKANCRTVSRHKDTFLRHVNIFYSPVWLLELHPYLVVPSLDMQFEPLINVGSTHGGTLNQTYAQSFCTEKNFTKTKIKDSKQRQNICINQSIKLPGSLKKLGPWPIQPASQISNIKVH